MGYVDDTDYLKADPSCYRQLARAVDASSVHQVSIEDAHCLNELDLLEQFDNTAIILGVITIASSQVETCRTTPTRPPYCAGSSSRPRSRVRSPA